MVYPARVACARVVAVRGDVARLGTVLLNAQNPRGLEYTLGEWPLMIAPMAALIGQQRTRRDDRRQPTDDLFDGPPVAYSPS